MARNKYPEITESRILETSMQLFIKKGYEQTTLQDVADAMGMTRGAIYHHFKNKEQMVDAVTAYMFSKAVPIQKIKEDMSISALEKIRKIVLCSISDEDQINIFIALSKTFIDNPKLVAAWLDNVKDDAVKTSLDLIEEGRGDGSVKVEHPQMAAELLSILFNVWLSPMIFLDTQENFKIRLSCAVEILNNIGLPIVDDELQTAFYRLIALLPEK